MPARKNEAVSSHPLGVTGVVSQMARPDRIRHCCGAHRQARVPGVGFLHAIGGQKAECIDCAGLQVVVCHVRNFTIHLVFFFQIYARKNDHALTRISKAGDLFRLMNRDPGSICCCQSVELFSRI